MRSVLLGFFAVAAHPVFACKCEMSLPVCQEVAYSGVVFAGTVESISPGFLSRWNLAQRASLDQLNQANERALADGSPASLAALKDAFRKVFPDLPEEQRRRLENAGTEPALAALFSSVLDHGKRVRLRVRTVFRKSDDDDGDDDAAKDPVFEVWTPFGDCGYDFQLGETYLVYAGNDEETSIMETDSCTRTKRLSDAGPDLAYLYFYKDKEHASGRLEGFTTFDPLYQVQQARPHDPDKIALPAEGLVVELKSDSGSRYTTSGPFGRFIFDGLEAADYKVAAYASGFPESIKLLAGPKGFHLGDRGCAGQILLIPKQGR
ncbi:MAG TPA: carboxypeptidase-like regulatory domain-containing protein [Bryobacteraceae bacterium]|nr:carboxypeptidase-like regulatory domain-containing protein [Bryobacteraceae bacterium]